ncbi:acyl-CoA dehydrogenase family protein [Novosphingobium terrae]|uniref:acyl-CoA dehydrogenase family protein n=1 Tax=Novosphingobium terrae TaxID=2726189 RepID=UPI0019816E75|nr:acyl-CoA dehydrogenase family protein [Novosphingobium terrae]
MSQTTTVPGKASADLRPDQAASQIAQGWGAGPSARYEQLAAPFRPVFQRIREDAAIRDTRRRLPFDELEWLKQARFTTLRVPESHGGQGVTLPELINLLIELSEADPNITNILRPHIGFTEDLLNSSHEAFRNRWLERIVAGDTFGNGFSETGGNVGAVTTSLVRDGEDYRLDGKKYYTTGTLFADWTNMGAVDENGDPTGAVIPTSAQGVQIIDDWNGFGQMLTGSGTTVFDQVRVPPELVNPEKGRARYVGAFFQLVHLATLAGIGRAAANDVARLIQERSRAYGHGNAAAARDDPQILAVVGKVRGAAYAAGAITLKVAEALQRVYDYNQSREVEAEEWAGAIADVEINEAVTVVSQLVLGAATDLFDGLGASGTSRDHALDRHWRNARTITSHNPRIYRDRIVGAFAVNGTLPVQPLRNAKDKPGKVDRNAASPPIL